MVGDTILVKKKDLPVCPEFWYGWGHNSGEKERPSCIRFVFRFWAKRPGSQVKTVPEPMISHLSPHSWEHLFFAEFGNLILSFYELQQMLALLVSCWALQYFGMYLLGIWYLGIVSKRVLILIAIFAVQS